MAFTDVTDGSRTLLVGVGAVKITLADDVKVGDPIGYNSGWVQADANGVAVATDMSPAILVAGQTGISGEVITAYRAAKLGGITTGTAGSKIYLSNTAGGYSATAGTYAQVVGYELGSGEIYVEPEEEQLSLDNDQLIYFGAASYVNLGWDGTNAVLEMLPATDDTGAFNIGDGTTDMDVKIFLGSTSNYIRADVGATQLELMGVDIVTDTAIQLNSSATFTMGASGAPSGDFVLWGTQALAKVWFDINGDTNGAFFFGADDTGVDVSFYGQTASNSMVWDASANALVFTAGGITMGVTSKLVLPVKASGSTTQGDFWLDTTDNLLHFYCGTDGEYTVTATKT